MAARVKHIWWWVIIGMVWCGAVQGAPREELLSQVLKITTKDLTATGRITVYALDPLAAKIVINHADGNPRKLAGLIATVTPLPAELLRQTQVTDLRLENLVAEFTDQEGSITLDAATTPEGSFTGVEYRWRADHTGELRMASAELHQAAALFPGTVLPNQLRVVKITGKFAPTGHRLTSGAVTMSGLPLARGVTVEAQEYKRRQWRFQLHLAGNKQELRLEATGESGPWNGNGTQVSLNSITGAVPKKLIDNPRIFPLLPPVPPAAAVPVRVTVGKMAVANLTPLNGLEVELPVGGEPTKWRGPCSRTTWRTDCFWLMENPW